MKPLRMAKDAGELADMQEAARLADMGADLQEGCLPQANRPHRCPEIEWQLKQEGADRVYMSHNRA